MDVNDVTGAVNQRKQVETAKEIASQEKRQERSVKPSQGAKDDSVTLSPAAKEKSKIAKYVDIINKMPDVREDEIARAKSNLEKGEYSSLDVAKKTAEKMLDE